MVTNNADNQWTLAPVIAAVIGLSLNVGAYASEIIRGGILSIPKGQTEAAYSIGMNYRQTVQRIILPQAIRVSIPALGNTFLSLIKDTSLLGFILVAEMFRKAQEVASTTYEYLTIYLLVALMYWVVCFVISIIQGWYESRIERVSLMIELSHIHKSFNETEVIKGIDLKVNQGEVVTLIGRSGSGKTTLLRMINALEIPTEGTVYVNGMTYNAKDKKSQIKVRQQSGMVFKIIIYFT